MHSLPILLIALALLPLSAAIKCYSGRILYNLNGTRLPSEEKVEKDCPDSQQCYWMHGENDEVRGDIFDCVKSGDRYTGERCRKNTDNTAKICGTGTDREDNKDFTYEECCCKGDLCNNLVPSTTVPPTTTTTSTPAPTTPTTAVAPNDSKQDGKNPAAGPTALFLSLAATAAVIAAWV